MTDQSPAALLRAAAEKVRQWATEATSDPWAPGAATTFGPELAAWLDSAAVDAEQIGADPRAMATARRILGAES
ncbi:hypothetical protein [Streptomyces sparsogenes]|uniref:Uncharacterized protein n=1 Tax=Streptomyces sparsogenes DSM 40356 TaxID=1331668 RepID=A0A1R1S828_9ACTN|nr:hypothetical protein [Streptomyces sparsogenes]OMI34444.1 hypothetical protein SPAR_36711 [Streptomyces sparsogenes DSM 40356]